MPSNLGAGKIFLKGYINGSVIPYNHLTNGALSFAPNNLNKNLNPRKNSITPKIKLIIVSIILVMFLKLIILPYYKFKLNKF